MTNRNRMYCVLCLTVFVAAAFGASVARRSQAQAVTYDEKVTPASACFLTATNGSPNWQRDAGGNFSTGVGAQIQITCPIPRDNQTATSMPLIDVRVVDFSATDFTSCTFTDQSLISTVAGSTFTSSPQNSGAAAMGLRSVQFFPSAGQLHPEAQTYVHCVLDQNQGIIGVFYREFVNTDANN